MMQYIYIAQHQGIHFCPKAVDLSDAVNKAVLTMQDDKAMLYFNVM